MRELVLDPQIFRVVFRTQAVFFTRIKFRLLKHLLASDGGFLNRQDLLSHVWGPQVSVEVRTIDLIWSDSGKNCSDWAIRVRLLKLFEV